MKSVTEERTMEHMMHILLPDLVKEVTNKMKKEKIELSTDTIINVLRLTMESVELSPLKGKIQKEVAIKVIVELANESGLTPENIEIIKSLAQGELISATIDLVVDAAKGKVNVNEVAKVAGGCLSKIFCCLMKSNRNNKVPKITIPEPDVPLMPSKISKQEEKEEKESSEHPEKAVVRPVTPPSPVIKSRISNQQQQQEQEQEQQQQQEPQPLTGETPSELASPNPKTLGSDEPAEQPADTQDVNNVQVNVD